MVSQQDDTKQKRRFTIQQRRPNVVSKQEASLQQNYHTTLLLNRYWVNCMVNCLIHQMQQIKHTAEYPCVILNCYTPHYHPSRQTVNTLYSPVQVEATGFNNIATMWVRHWLITLKILKTQVEVFKLQFWPNNSPEIQIYSVYNNVISRQQSSNQRIIGNFA